MSEAIAFGPQYSPSTGTTQGSLLPSTTVSATASAVASTRFSGTNWSGKRQLQVSNTSTVFAYINFGNIDKGAVTAATVAASWPVAPGTVIVTVDSEINAASVILASGTGTVVFTRGDGF